MASTANWIAAGITGGLAGFTGLALRPGTSANRFEQDLAWGSLFFGFLAQTTRFVSEALHYGRWPVPPDAYATNWIRYTGAGVGTVFYLAALASLSRGGVFHWLFTVLGVAFYYALLTFASLAFGDEPMVIAMFVLGAFVFVVTMLMYWRLHSGQRDYCSFVPAITWLLEIGFVTAAGINVFRRHTASNAAEDWVFAAIGIAKALWALNAYLGGVDGTWLQDVMNGGQAKLVSVSDY